jgi:RHS repeat-associated protein
VVADIAGVPTEPGVPTTWATATTTFVLAQQHDRMVAVRNAFIYGPNDLPIEQINNSTGTVLYLYHDQQGSTRLLTGSTGKTEGSYSYSPYGTPEHSGTATTPLGFDGQYTSADTGLIYLRAREYDPATGQFLSVDPLETVTGAPYYYAGDNPNPAASAPARRSTRGRAAAPT